MTNKVQIPQPYRINLYTEFILWSAMPEMEHRKLGIETQGQFAEYYNVTEQTLSRWKNRPDFHERRMAILRMWAKDKTPNVVQGIYKSAIKGNSDSQRIWLKFFEGWTDETKVENVVKVEITQNDIRRLIEALPEDLKQKHYGYLRELLDDASAYRDSGQLEDSRWSDKPALPIPIAADYDAQDIQVVEANEVSKSYPHGLRANMVGEVPAHHYQSSAWWGKEQTAGYNWI